ncbi:hypothetical protein CC1G_04249 [Coprinopsis cinerea okayama7|uniref:Uncharacterized protein n=1 Tax=Coprinopsis cinerea (strain Okayama-7 / 130 / ATCC MYA-4618 / FGSC 9003) TaxID=240176 RepID=A8NFF5_COPC7|nr:hypothetical protein CC1G_04249 [Coprinopsis cinerea okayama7\|eukprot:XP_001833270.1 hypothetical protein CC1G_04249 [Coprinopsis cinerea okayama7\
MSHRENSIAALNLLIAACDAAVSAIDAADGNLDDDLKDLDQTSLNVIHKDFLALLSLLYASTTKIALCLKPSSPTYSASITPLKDQTTHVGNLSQNVRLVRKEHGLTLLNEFKSVAKTVINPLKQLAQVFLDHANGEKVNDDAYLSKTGEVHHAIDKARSSPGGLSSSNHIAVKKAWGLHQGSLIDAMDELKELSESEGSPGSTDDIDDGWDELGIDAPSKMSAEELGRLKKVEPIIKLSTLLHKYVAKRLLSAPYDSLPIQTHLNPLLDSLAKDSALFAAAVDDLASTVYAPQDTEEMSLQLRNFTDFIETLSSRITSILSLPSVGELLKGSGKEASAQKWFDTCFDQLNKSIKELSDVLPDP